MSKETCITCKKRPTAHWNWSQETYLTSHMTKETCVTPAHRVCIHRYKYICIHIHIHIHILIYTYMYTCIFISMHTDPMLGCDTGLFRHVICEIRFLWPVSHAHSKGQEAQRLNNTGWRRLIGSPKLQIIFHKRATKYRSLLREMTYKDKGSYESSPPCTHGNMSNEIHHMTKVTYITRQKRCVWHDERDL